MMSLCVCSKQRGQSRLMSALMALWGVLMVGLYVPSYANALPELTLTSVPGILVGHATDSENNTGCTAILCPTGFTPGVAVPGFAPGSRETELMRPESVVQEVHGIMLSGGSAFGLTTATGAVRYLREQGMGLKMPHAIIPLVPAAIIYDLDTNKQPGVLPDETMGYQAAASATANPVRMGAVGAGTGARCGRLGKSVKAGLGSAGVQVGDVLVTALVVVNALGNVHNPDTGQWLAGAVNADGQPLTGMALLEHMAASKRISVNNTVLAVVATNVPLSKVATNRLAHMAGAGLARTIRPAHMIFDGDIVFALSAKEGPNANENLVGAMGAEAIAQAAAQAVLSLKRETTPSEGSTANSQLEDATAGRKLPKSTDVD